MSWRVLAWVLLGLSLAVPVQAGPWKEGGNPGFVTGGGLRWVRVHGGAIPTDAVVGGQSLGRDLYICRARFRGGVHVGKVLSGRCNIGWGGKEERLAEFEVLVGQVGGARWVDPYRRGLYQPVLGGHDPTGQLYICRAYYRNGTHIGKAIGGRCLIGWGGREVAVSDYQILVAPRVYWVTTTRGNLPRGAVGGARAEGRDMYVCRGYYRDGVHPGKYWRGECHIGWGGKEVRLDHFEVLVQPGGVNWQPASAGHIPSPCVEGGRDQGHTQCVCRGYYRDGVHVGKTWNGRCNIGWGGREVVLDNFEVLVSY